MNMKFLGQNELNGRLIEEYEVEDGLTLPKVTNYIELLVNQGFTFERADIYSSSDKDNWQTFSGHESYSKYETFVNMLKSDRLAKEPGVIVSFEGEINGEKKWIDFYVDKNDIVFHTPINNELNSEIVTENSNSFRR